MGTNEDGTMTVRVVLKVDVSPDFYVRDVMELDDSPETALRRHVKAQARDAVRDTWWAEGVTAEGIYDA
jgi:hypothetical protein